MLLSKFRLIWQSSFREEDFLELNDSTNQKQELPHFVPIQYQTWPPQAILVSDWSISKKSSPLKPSSQMNRNLVGSA
jgi:hypothetical protein